MPNSDLTLEEVRRLAADVGLTRLDEAQLAQLMKATNVARARSRSLPFGTLAPADEPAHVFRLEGEAR